jgi:hypothetical protein
MRKKSTTNPKKIKRSSTDARHLARCQPRTGKPVGTPGVADQRLVSRLIDDVPTNWLDPLLTGSKAVIDHRKNMFTCADIERLFNALRARMCKTANEKVQI